MRLFRWLPDGPVPPSADLRRCGWQIAQSADLDRDGDDEDVPAHPALVHVSALDDPRWTSLGDWRFQPLRRLVLLIGIEDSDARARLLRLGFGDVLGIDNDLHEVEARASRVAGHAALMPRTRKIGGLRLDLFARDGFAGGRALGLHPREFALIWRLAETPGIAVPKKQLVRDVWRMAYVPDTNSLAVHVFRLRAKLALAGLAGLVQTAAEGGYFLAQGRLAENVSIFRFAEAGGEEQSALALSTERNLPWEPNS